MLTRTLGKTGLSVSVLGFGAAPVAFLKSDQDRAADIVEKLLRNGVNLIDTAASYPGSEEFLGNRFSAKRDSFVLVSKCAGKVEASAAPPWSAEQIAASVDQSLRRLRTDHVDVMLLHSCDLATLQKGEALGALVEARRAGKIRFVGYSGDNDAAAYAAALPEVAVIETSINIADQNNIDSVLPVAVKHNVGVIAKRPIANSAWKDVSQLQGMYQSYAKTYIERMRQMAFTPASVGFRTAAEETAWPEMALRFTLSQPGVTTAIIGTTSPENAAANVAYADNGLLPAEIVQKVRSIFRNADPERKWTGQT